MIRYDKIWYDKILYDKTRYEKISDQMLYDDYVKSVCGWNDTIVTVATIYSASGLFVEY